VPAYALGQYTCLAIPKAYAADPASVGMARNPTPTIPTVNKAAANFPATGRTASAAEREVSMCVNPVTVEGDGGCCDDKKH